MGPTKDGEMTPDLSSQWSSFLAGRWTADMPQKEGQYFLRTSEGYPGGTGVVFKDPFTGGFRTPTFWGGDWWSEPTPPLPGIKN